MDSSILTSVATGGAVATAVIVAVKAVFETRNLRSRNIKEMGEMGGVEGGSLGKEVGSEWGG
jgi:hypothetical protein